MTRVQHLTEMQVAVDADALTAGRRHHVAGAGQLVGARPSTIARSVAYASGNCDRAPQARAASAVAVLRIDW